MKLSSTAFRPFEAMPTRYTCDGDNVNPPLLIADVPPQAQSLTLILEDPDAPSGTYTHWLVYDIRPSIAELPEDRLPPGVVGLNDFGDVGYGGPCPPSGTHRYIFRLYALDTTLGLSEGARKSEVLEKIKGHILATTELISEYSRRRRTEPRST